MKQLLTIAAVLATLFASTFLVLSATGLLTVDNIRQALTAAAGINPVYVALAVIGLLFADMFIAVPTLTISILAGYFLGFTGGFASAASGLLLAGFSGYWICRRYGPALLHRILKDQNKLDEMQQLFNKSGPVMLLICRAGPIIPEVTCCLAGANNMPPRRFALWYSLGTLPYAAIAAAAGSQSTLSDPLPAIYAALGLSLGLWGAWAIVWRQKRRSRLPC